jgi:hypothetical protein
VNIMIRTIILAASCLLVSGLGTAQAEIYKSVTASGETSYTDHPSGDPTNVEIVTPKHGGTTITRETVEQRLEASNAAKAEAAKTAQKEADAATDLAMRQRNCDQAKQRAASLERPRINKVNDDGSRTRMPEEWRQSELAAAKDALATYCE